VQGPTTCIHACSSAVFVVISQVKTSACSFTAKNSWPIFDEIMAES